MYSLNLYVSKLKSSGFVHTKSYILKKSSRFIDVRRTFLKDVDAGTLRSRKKRCVFIYFHYLGRSLSDLVFSWSPFEPLWPPFGVLGFPL